MTLFGAVESALLAWPKAAQDGARVIVPTHCIYPSNTIVSVVVEGGGKSYRVHDNAGALDDVEAIAGEVRGAVSLARHVIRRQGLDIDSRGTIFAPWVELDALGATIALVANASKEAAGHVLGHYKPLPRRNFGEAVEQLLTRRFPHAWTKRPAIVGESNKLHHFDYEVQLSQQRKLVFDAVLPEASSINAAVVAHLDVKRVHARDLIQHIVYDDDLPWKSADISLLAVGAPPVPFSLAHQVFDRLAA